MNILVLSMWYPYPPDNGIRIRIYNVIKHLAERHRVSVLSFAGADTGEPAAQALRAICERVEVVRHDPFARRPWRSRLAWLLPQPQFFTTGYSRAMQRACDELAAQTDFDLVISSTFMIAPYAAKVGPVPKIIDMMEVSQFVSDTPRALQSWPARQRTALRSAKLVRFLLQLSRSHRYCATASVQERADLDALVGGWPGETRVIPNCIELGSYANIAPNPGACHALIFSGNLTFGPNLDAMRFFLAEIWPLVRAEQPSSHLKITGHADRAALGPLADDSQVILTGYLPDVRQAVADAMVSVAPLRTGGGTRLKILEAMAIGTPVVATSKGAEGLDVRHEEHLLIADEPRVFAECVIRLLRDAGLRRTLAANARALVAAQYDWAVVMPHYLDWIEELAATGRKTAVSPG